MERDLNLQLIRAHLSPLINYLGDLNYYFYGGCLRDLFSGNIPNDYDMACDSQDTLDEIVLRLEEGGWVLELETNNGLKFKYLNNILDISTKDFMTPEEKLTQMDFTINAITYTSDDVCIYHNTAFDDITEKLLIPIETTVSSNETLTTRAIKFWADGYKPKSNRLPIGDTISIESVYVDDVNYGVFDLRR